MSVKGYAAYKPGTVRPGPEFLCSVCGTWFKKMLYWKDSKFHPEQKYRMHFYCGAKCVNGEDRASETQRAT
jgi:hypothetical protein